MNSANLPLPTGYSPVAPGHIVSVVTCLEMTAPARLRPLGGGAAGFSLRLMDRSNLAAYRALFREVGEDWLWFSRLIMADNKLKAILADPLVEPFALGMNGRPAGILELDFREERQCEIAFIGVVNAAVGTGAGRFLMNEAIKRAWARPIRRLWVHTCSFDHPNAMAFYLRSGFRPYARMVEVHEDPRLSGHLPRTAAAHVPLIE